MMNSRIEWLVNNVRGKKILDIGFVGRGQEGLKLHNLIKLHNPGSTLIGLDNNKEAIKKFNDKSLFYGDANNLSFKDSSFDAVILGEVIEHFFDINKIISECSRVLKTNGKLYITTPNTYAFFRWLKHWLFSPNFFTINNSKSYLACSDHKVFWEPLSLINILNHYNLETIHLTTKVLGFPYINLLRNKNVSIWPISRLQEYICLISQKK